MKFLPTPKQLKVTAAVLMIPALFAGTVALQYLTPSSSSDKASNAALHNKPSGSTSKEQDANSSSDIPQEKSNSTTTSNKPTASPTTRQVAGSTNSPQTVASATSNNQGQSSSTAVTCNESMKTSYTNSYNSQVAAENSKWNNQVNAWGNYANSIGRPFGGYVQDMINQHKPAHDAKLAQLQSQYQQNLSSINCSL